MVVRGVWVPVVGVMPTVALLRRQDLCATRAEAGLRLLRRVDGHSVGAMDRAIATQAAVREGAGGSLRGPRRVDCGGLVVVHLRSEVLAVERATSFDALHFLATPVAAAGKAY